MVGEAAGVTVGETGRTTADKTAKPATEATETLESGPATPPLLAALIFLVALNLRPAIAGVGPVLTRIGDDLGWGESVLGVLGAMPLWAFAAVSPLIRFVTKRFGTNRTILIALLVLAAGDLIRSLGGPSGVWLGTFAVGAGIAAGNVLVPVIAKRDYAGHVAVATGVYSGCITAGSAIAGLTAAPLAARFGGWRPALAVWAVPPLIVAALWLIRVVRDGQENRNAGTGAGTEVSSAAPSSSSSMLQAAGSSDAVVADDSDQSGADRASAPNASSTAVTAAAEPAAELAAKPAPDPRPLWRRPMTWWVTLFMGLQSSAFYTMSNWLPSLATASGFTESQAGVQLFVFQSLGILSGLLIPVLMHVRGNQICAALTASAPMVIAGFGWMLLPRWSMLWSVIGGAGQGASLVVALTLISLRGRDPQDTVALSGLAQSLGYLIASIGPLAFGSLAELSGTWIAPLVLFTAFAVGQCVVAVLAGAVRWRNSLHEVPHLKMSA
ncbi:MFS transporter [Bifidobacterium callitrichidarum]|uniref:MFS transporter n=2 Tax=Bifidobacterium callitrichidarum TaxID=2052941 RepID=A0A2U2N3Q2_9BIFI|nr:MFS transporter [Bifidobacterium callitrichidarum]